MLNKLQTTIENISVGLDNLNILNSIDYFTLFLNLMMFIFAGKLISKTNDFGKPAKNYDKKVKVLRGLNLVLFAVYSFFIVFKISVVAQLAQTYLVIIFGFIATHYISHMILVKHGEIITIDEESCYTDTYLSKMLRFGALIGAILVSALFLVSLWGLQAWFENASIFVFIGLTLFFTKDYWLEDLLSSFTIHSKGVLKRGSIVRFSDSDNFYIILETGFINTWLKNLKTDTEKSVKNSKLVKDNVEHFSMEKSSNGSTSENGKKSKKEYKPTKQYIHFNIGYGSTSEEVEFFFDKVMEEAQKKCKTIGKSYVVNVNNAGDHAIAWELLYTIENPFQILNARNTINRIAVDKQRECNIDLSTPITHTHIKEDSVSHFMNTPIGTKEKRENQVQDDVFYNTSSTSND